MENFIGGRGIDTQFERERIEYNPLLSYIKEYIYSEGTRFGKDFVIPEEVNSFISKSPTVTLSKLDESVVMHDYVIEKIENILANDSVQISSLELPEEEMSQVIEFCEGNQIRFRDFKRAVENIESENAIVVVEAYEAFHSNITGRFEALLYRPLYFSRREVKLSVSKLEEFFLDIAPESIEGEVRSAIKEGEQSFAKELLRVKREKELLQSQISEIEDAANSTERGPVVDRYESLKSQLDEVLKQERTLEINPLAITSKLFYERAQESNRFAEKAYGLVMHTLADSFHGMLGYFIKKVVKINQSSNTFDTEAFRHEVQRVIMYCETIKKALVYSSIGFSLKGISASNVFYDIVNGFVDKILSQSLRLFYELKTQITLPIHSWLIDLAEIDPDIEYTPVSRLANLLLDILDQIENQFKNTIMDFKRNSLKKRKESSLIIELVGEKKWVSDLYIVLDEISRDLRHIASIPNLEEFVLDKWVSSLIVSNGWDKRYDPNKDTFYNVESVIEIQ